MTTQPTSLAAVARAEAAPADDSRPPIFEVSDLAVSYNGNVAIRDVSLDVRRNAVTAFIGPSGWARAPSSAASTG
ncbi:MAG TPA: hypothetical protein VNT58_04095 [Gaiellaceae bacterium]|nr:hypothetical protein [Gaiellaceae bacterium]